MEQLTAQSFIGSFLLMMGAFVFVSAILVACVYVYTSLAYMRIANKTGTKPAWLAWIPVANIYLLSQMAQMHWWPVLLMIGIMFPNQFLSALSAFALSVFSIIWNWKIFEKIGRPGWWALLSLIPVVGWITFLILLGVAAWGKEKESAPVQ